MSPSRAKKAGHIRGCAISVGRADELCGLANNQPIRALQEAGRIDKDTAILIDPGDCWEAAGSGAVTIIDAVGLGDSSLSRAREEAALSVPGLKLPVHRLVQVTGTEQFCFSRFY